VRSSWRVEHRRVSSDSARAGSSDLRLECEKNSQTGRRAALRPDTEKPLTPPSSPSPPPPPAHPHNSFPFHSGTVSRSVELGPEAGWRRPRAADVAGFDATGGVATGGWADPDASSSSSAAAADNERAGGGDEREQDGAVSLCSPVRQHARTHSNAHTCTRTVGAKPIFLKCLSGFPKRFRMRRARVSLQENISEDGHTYLFTFTHARGSAGRRACPSGTGACCTSSSCRCRPCRSSSQQPSAPSPRPRCARDPFAAMSGFKRTLLLARALVRD
jgi:hypothetical protein